MQLGFQYYPPLTRLEAFSTRRPVKFVEGYRGDSEDCETRALQSRQCIVEHGTCIVELYEQLY